MDVYHLQLFVAVAEELHFGRAAEKLHMTQPPVTRGIQHLERELGSKLFDRSTRSVRLTATGEALVEPAKDVLSAVRRARGVVEAAGRGEVGRVRLAYAGASTHVLVGVLAREVRRDHPGIEFGLYSRNFALPAMGQVLRKEMDLCLGRWDVVPADVRTRVVAEEHLVIAVPVSHRLADAEGVWMTELAEEPFVTLPPHEGAVLGDRLRRLSHGAGFDADVVQIAPESWTAMSLVGAAVGCSLTLSSVAENVNDPHVRFVRVLDETLPVQLQLAWRADDRNPALAAVLELIERVWPAPPATSS
ncbi:LysR substrate-binding domain-containing protein [Dietzia natronolimnaea]|uniref:LysR substrate-binding domain-containing protein n=1 Tax=Dietzia natronolimnaea TaxID=161920 RepID=UPI0015F8D907|nr:LysR substrate-binding domain-containing protein [Dietzia natronolimnaea]MBB1037677.1 LysR family transcriptional regulator [Dietzia natronolimnaea]